jgi:hypothetical protein
MIHPERSPASRVAAATDVRFLRPAAGVRAAAARAGIIGAALPGLAAAIHRDLPGFAGHAVQGAAFPFAQFPADGADQLVAGPGGELTDILLAARSILSVDTVPHATVCMFRR